MRFPFRAFSRDLGIDLGTANTLVYMRERGIVVNEPSVVAMNARTGKILAVGRAAKDMQGRTPGHIVTVRPLLKGVISDFEVTEKMLRYFIDVTHADSTILTPRPRVVVGVPLEITEVERKAVEDASRGAGAREVFLIEEPMAGAIGARLPIEDAIGTMVVDLGGGTTEIAVISLGGIVAWKSITIAGDEMNKTIVQFARDAFGLILGERIAERIKIAIGSAAPLDEPLQVEMRGRDMISGLPREVFVHDTQIREALARPIRTIIDTIKMALEMTPPELVADIYERGIVLLGGGALLRGLDGAIARATGIPVRIAEDPLTAVVRGAGALLENEELLGTLALPSAQEHSPHSR